MTRYRPITVPTDKGPRSTEVLYRRGQWAVTLCTRGNGQPVITHLPSGRSTTDSTARGAFFGSSGDQPSHRLGTLPHPRA